MNPIESSTWWWSWLKHQQVEHPLVPWAQLTKGTKTRCFK